MNVSEVPPLEDEVKEWMPVWEKVKRCLGGVLPFPPWLVRVPYRVRYCFMFVGGSCGQG